MTKIIWTPLARMSLQQTVDFLTEIWNGQVADEFLRQLDYRIAQIQRNPGLGPTFLGSEFRQLLIHKSTSLFYRCSHEHIKLLLIWDNRQDPSALYKKLTEANTK